MKVAAALAAPAVLSLMALASGGAPPAAPVVLEDGATRAAFDPSRGGLTSLRRAGDVHPTEYLLEGAVLGDVTVRCRPVGGAWREASTAASGDGREVRTGSAWAAAAWTRDSADPRGLRGLSVEARYELKGGALEWTIRLANRTGMPLEVCPGSE